MGSKSVEHMSESAPGATDKVTRAERSSDQTPTSSNPLAWFRVFGPGAVIASLTIGAGELIFSSRAGALFGYRLLWFFVLVLLLKWALVFASARHMVLTGAHPFQRWMDLPGPRGWLPLIFLLLALPCFPIWVCFHAGTVGTLVSFVAGTDSMLNGAAHLAWGLIILGGVLLLILTGGYARLERIQIAITLAMVFAVTISLAWLKPDWWSLWQGFVVPVLPEYPKWIGSHPEFAQRPIWVEAVTYIGIIGGSGYDYLAYVSYVRDKGWGQAGSYVADASQIETMALDRTHPNRRWVRVCLADCALSFLAVLIFTVVFVACGTIVLGPQGKVPSGTNLLALQAEFVTPILPWLKWVYFSGAFLAMFGTLYGTIEVAPTVLREMMVAAKPVSDKSTFLQSRRWAVAWVGGGGAMILLLSFIYTVQSEGKSPPGLVAILTPANLFTGVLACGLVCLLNTWIDGRFLPPGLRMHWSIWWLNLLAGGAFLALGLKGYWDHSRWTSLAILAGTLAAGWLVARFWGSTRRT